MSLFRKKKVTKDEQPSESYYYSEEFKKEVDDKYEKIIRTDLVDEVMGLNLTPFEALTGSRKPKESKYPYGLDKQWELGED